MRPHLIRGLVVFCAAARYLSFKMAAAELFITPSAVSHQIKALEDQFGEPLFERRTRSIELTALGLTLYAQVDPLLRSLDGVTSNFLESARQRRTLRISLPPFFASEMLVPRLSEFTSRHPSIDIRVDTNAIRDGEFPRGTDAAVLLLSEPPTDYAAEPLFPVKLVPACSPQLASEVDATNPGALANCTLIIHKSRPEAWQDWFKAAGLKADVQPRVIHLDSMFAVARAAERGVGIALVPVPLSDAWFRSNALVQLFDTALETGERYYFARSADQIPDIDVETLRRWVVDVCRPA